MPIASNIRAGAAFIEVSVNNSKFVKGLKQARAKLLSFGSTLKTVGANLLKFSALAAAPIALAIKKFTSFSDAMLTVKAVTGATEKEFKRLEEAAKELGRTTSFTAQEAAEGMVELGRAGLKTEQILSAMPNVLDLARASGTELKDTASILTNTMKAFNLTAQDSARIADTLTFTVNNSAQTLTDFSEAMKTVAPIANAAGESLEEVSAAIGVLATGGIKGSRAGTALARAYKNLAKAPIAKFLREQGVEVADQSGNLRKVVDIIGDIGRVTKDLGTQQKIEIFDKVFGRGAVAALNLTGKATKDFLKLLKTEAQGEASKTAKIIDSGLGGAFRLLASSVEGLQIALADILKGVIKDIAEKLKDVTGIITAAIKANKGLVLTIAKTIAIVAAAGIGLIALGSALSLVAFAIKGIIAAFSLFGSAVVFAGTVLSALLSPIGLISGAVIALIAVLLKFSDTGKKIVAFLGSRFKWLKDVAIGAFKGIRDALAAGDIALAAKIVWLALKFIFQKGINELEKLWLDFKVGLQKTFINLKATLTKLWQDLWFGLKEVAIKLGIAKFFIKTFNLIESAWLKTTQFMKDAWLRVSSAILLIWNRATKAINKLQEATADKFVSVLAFFDESLDENELRKSVKDQFSKEQKKLDKELNKTAEQFINERAKLTEQNAKENKDIEQRQKDRLEELQRLKKIGQKGRLSELEQEKIAVDTAAAKEKSALENRANMDLKDSAKQLRDARNAFSDILRKARDNAQQVKTAGQERKTLQFKERSAEEFSQFTSKIPTLTDDILKSAVGSIQAVGPILNKTIADIKGGFNVQNLLGFQAAGAVSPENKTANNTAMLVKLQKKTIDEIKDSTENFT